MVAGGVYSVMGDWWFGWYGHTPLRLSFVLGSRPFRLAKGAEIPRCARNDRFCREE